MPRSNTIDNIWSYIDVLPDKTKCWLWKKSTQDKRGYGQTHFRGKHIRAHRLVFQLTNGFLPPVVMHSCDNPTCCNPNHLVAGTYDKNNKDRAQKGRSNRVGGEKHTQSKLTQFDVSEIRRLYLETPRSVSVGEIAKKYNIHYAYVRQVAVGLRWKATE